MREVTSSKSGEAAVGGLRARKKASTRRAIRTHAMALFAERGYERTTVEQIAAAADVSPSTFFRYFPTKEDVALQDDYDALLTAAFRAQPAALPPVRALRNAIDDVFSSIPERDRDQEIERARLVATVPDLRARMLVQVADLIHVVAEALAERVGRPADDFEVHNLAGAIIGIALNVVLPPTVDPGTDFLARLDRGLAHLEAGLPLT